jgi:hypothetical protein
MLSSAITRGVIRRKTEAKVSINDDFLAIPVFYVFSKDKSISRRLD